MAVEINDLADQTHRMAKNLEESHKAAQGLELSFAGIAKSAARLEALKIVWDFVRGSQLAARFQAAISTEGLNHVKLAKKLTDQTNLYLGRIKVADEEGKFRTEKFQRELALRGQTIVATEKQLHFAKTLADVGKVQLGLFAGMVGAATDLFYKQRQLNQDLIEANSSYQTRAFLLKESLMTTAQLGISFEKVTASARALVHWGLDTEATFSRNVRLVAQMEQGLGVSVNESARLATIVERQLRGSFEGVAHVVAQLVDDTALAGDEAARLATSIATAMGRLRPGLSAQSLPEVLKLVGRYESALKEVGGAPGAFQQLVESLTRPEGIVGAGALGISPEFISTTKGVQDVMDRFAQYGQALVGQSEGWARQMRLQQLGEIFHVSADQANQLLLAIRRARDAQTDQISVQDRWRQQLHATNSGIIRLANSMAALLNGAMYPVIFAVGAITNKMADFLEFLLKMPETVYAVSGALFLGFAALSASMYRVARALVATVATSTAATAAVARFNAAMAATTGTAALGGVGSYLRYTGVGTFGTAFGGIFTSLRSVFTVAFWQGLATGIRALVVGIGATTFFLSAILVALGSILYVANKWRSETKALDEQSRQIQIANIEKEKALEENRYARIFHEARNLGSSAVVLRQYKELTKDMALLDLSQSDYQAKLAEAAERAIRTVDQGVTTKVMYTPLRERTAEDAKREEELLSLTGKLYEVNKQARDDYRKKGVGDAERDAARDAEIAKQRLMNQFNEMSRRRNDMPFY